ncbi:hypothetical protein FF125_06995 [Aureibaculum algae]|uniref:DUF3108 domain-containing protein n=1 Tax=Aureibaculum algae TaxID=2584122 RepID=A0A5B7TMW9_9FLAO|nr:hypothetical protein [Aureibaculum algae]QCX38189.1 hypothetical protein FF125_06995 [Aureibaculum algae]
MKNRKLKILSSIIGTFLFSSLMAQDGSNIKYYEPDKLDSNQIGKLCHIDFGKISFRGQVIDTIEINVQGELMKFYEHREDNGFNNWFNKQYLIRVSTNKHSTALLQNSRIDSLTTDKIFVTSILVYYNYEEPADTITIIQHSYDKTNVAKVLVKN